MVGGIVFSAIVVDRVGHEGKDHPAGGLSLKQISAFWITLLQLYAGSATRATRSVRSSGSGPQTGSARRRWIVAEC
jgi:hypothetical protein